MSCDHKETQRKLAFGAKIRAMCPSSGGSMIFFRWKKLKIIMSSNIVKSGTVLSGHPVISGWFSKSRNFPPLVVVIFVVTLYLVQTAYLSCLKYSNEIKNNLPSEY